MKVLFLILALLTVGRGADADGHLEYYRCLLTTHSFPEEQTVNAASLLHDSIYGISEKFPAKRAPLDFLARKEGNKILVDEEIPKVWATKKGARVPVDGLLSLHASVEAALINKIGLSQANARELAFRIQKVAVDSLGESWSDYKEFLGPFLKKYGEPIELSARQMKLATQEIRNSIELDTTFDIPATAGYSLKDPKKIYIDRGAAKVFETSSGDKIDSVPFLVVHEVVEKALIDELGFKERSYQRTHQIAQRLEKEAVLAYGHSWDEYQYEVMEREIEKAYHKPVKRAPRDLDLTPYRDTNDPDMIEQIKKAMVGIDAKHI